MQHIKITFPDISQDMSDMLIATLSEAGYSGFEEQEHELLAYIEEAGFQEDELQDIAIRYSIGYDKEIIPSQNWNALWESNFEPVVVDGFCTIRAHFHDMAVSTPYDIVITPKMSFGTGHHATTQLMMMMMKDLDLRGKSVLDFGTGTGVLAILAEMLGASQGVAIDNDEWSVENALENIERNQREKIQVKLGSLEIIAKDKFDVVLANINRHILLNYIPQIYEALNTNGVILMSGLLTADEEIIVKAATGSGFRFLKMKEQNNWIALLFAKF